MLRYSIATSDRTRGWDSFDAMVLWAASKRRTFDGIVQALREDGIAFHLIHKSLDVAVADGLLLQVVDDTNVRYLLTPAGRARLTPTDDRDQQAAA